MDVSIKFLIIKIKIGLINIEIRAYCLCYSDIASVDGGFDVANLKTVADQTNGLTDDAVGFVV